MSLKLNTFKTKAVEYWAGAATITVQRMTNQPLSNFFPSGSTSRISKISSRVVLDFDMLPSNLAAFVLVLYATDERFKQYGQLQSSS